MSHNYYQMDDTQLIKVFKRAYKNLVKGLEDNPKYDFEYNTKKTIQTLTSSVFSKDFSLLSPVLNKKDV